MSPKSETSSELYATGVEQFASGNYDAAIQSAGRALLLNPKDEQVLELKVESLRLLRRFDEAQRCADDALKIYPASVPLLTERGTIFYDQGQYDSALTAFDDALRQDSQTDNPPLENTLLLKIESLRLLRRFDEAQRCADDALKIYPASVPLLTERGTIFYNQGQYDSAVTAFDDALRQNSQMDNPPLENTLLLKIESLRALRRFDEAHRCADDALKIYPTSVPLLTARGNIFDGQGQYDNAMTAFDNALRQSSKTDESALEGLLVSKADTLRLLRKFDEADRCIKEGLASHPQFKSLLAESGHVLLDRGDYNGALAVYETVLGADSTNALVLSGKASALASLGRFDEADAAISEALVKLRSNVFVRVMAGRVCIAEHRYADAVEQLEEANRLSPANANILFQWGYALESAGRFWEAIEKYEAAKELDASIWQLFYNIAAAYDYQGTYVAARPKWKEASRVLKDAMDSNDPNSDVALVCYYYGLMQHQIFGEFCLARDAYKRGIKSDPRRPWCLMGLANVLLEQRESPAIRTNRKVREAPDEESRAATSAEAWDAYSRASALINATPAVKPDADSLRAFAELQIAFRDFDAAKKTLKDLATSDQLSARVRSALGVLYSAQKDYGRAARSFEEATQREPRNLTMRNNLGEAYAKSGQLDAAEREFKEILLRTNEYMEAEIGLGDVYTALADAGDADYYAQATQHFEKAINQAIRNNGRRLPQRQLSAAYYSNGYAHAKAAEAQGAVDGDLTGWRRAVEAFENCLVTDPDNAKASRSANTIKKQLRRSTTQTVNDLLASILVTTLALMIFVFAQFAFYFGYANSPTSERSAAVANAAPLAAAKGGRVSSKGVNQSARRASVVSAAPLTTAKGGQGPASSNGVNQEGSKRQRISEASYVSLTFGALLLMVTGFYLPRVLKLKVGTLELEKSTADRISTPTIAGIKK